MFTNSVEQQKHYFALVVCVPTTSASAGASHIQNTWEGKRNEGTTVSQQHDKTSRTSDHKLLNLARHARVGHGALRCLRIGLHVFEQVVDVGVGQNSLCTK